MSRKLACLYFLLLPMILCRLDAAEKQAKEPSPIISRIMIRNTDIFDFESNVSLNHFPYNTINFLHVKTREHVIQRELLFKVGDRYDPFLADETVRNLRSLSFIRAARISKFPQRDGTVALVVHVNDAWTTEPQINLGGQNKIDTTEFGFKEKNLFGLGKTVGIFYEKGTNYIQREYSYRDPRLLGSRWQLSGFLKNKTDGNERQINLERPFYSADAHWSARASHNRLEAVLDQFENNALVSKYQQQKETSEVASAVKIGGGREVVNHAGLRYKRVITNYERIDQTPSSREVPKDDITQTVFLDMDTGRSRFIEMTHLEKMTRVEDLNLGPALRLSPGVSPKKLNGRNNETEGEAAFDKKTLFGDRLFSEHYSYSGRNPLENGKNQRYEVHWKYYDRRSEIHTIVLNTRAEWGDKLAPDNQVKLGGNNGLRAFEADGIVGNKGWILNAEDRIFLIDELFSLISVGAVVFYDTGYVWAQGQPIALSKLRSNVGAGLRFGLTRSSNEVIIRVDFSYRTQVNNPGDSHMVVTFGTGQAF